MYMYMYTRYLYHNYVHVPTYMLVYSFAVPAQGLDHKTPEASLAIDYIHRCWAAPQKAGKH